ncbi:MAG: DUF4412 domain-containing protein [Chlorobiaceae bacterium]|nr:DUF4412 domain-containing protein [Chlorobiaceae bacterium]NTW11082.1 DUF4412 domain-containing protein [Chlorobiaceae bacterium]
MKKIPIVCLLLLHLFAFDTSSAAVKFTGVMEMKLGMPNGSADATYYFGNNAQRMDMVMKMNKIPDPLKTTVITKASNPDQAIVVNYQARSYTSVNLRTAAENAMLLDFDSNYRLSRLGKDTVKGYSCEHINLTSTTEKLDMWVSRDLGDFSTFSILQSQNPHLSNSALAKTLKNGGIEGFPVKIVQKNNGGTSTMELRAIQKKTVSPELFDVPAGFRKVSDNQKPLDKSEKEHLKSLMEKMKKFEQ